MTEIFARQQAQIRRLEELLKSARDLSEQRRIEIERLRSDIAHPRCRCCSAGMPTVCNGCFTEAL